MQKKSDHAQKSSILYQENIKYDLETSKVDFIGASDFRGRFSTIQPNMV